MDTATLVMTYVMLGWGLNVVVGLAGLLDLGYVAFYAVGAYSYALLAAHFDWSFWFCLPAAGRARRPVGRGAGLSRAASARRLSGHRHHGLRRNHPVVLINWTSLTNGSNGLSVPKLTFFGPPVRRRVGQQLRQRRSASSTARSTG